MPATHDLPDVQPLLGSATKAVTTALTGSVTSTVDETAAPAADLLGSLLDATPVPSIIDSTPIVSTAVHGLVATTAAAVDTVTGVVDHGVSPTLGMLGIGVAPVHDTVDDIVTPVITPLSSQTAEPATPVRPIATLPLGPPATAPPVIPGVVALPTAPPKSSAIRLRAPRGAHPVRSGAPSWLDATSATTSATVSAGTPAVATPDVAGLLGTPGTGLPDQPTSNLPAPVSAGGLGNAAPALGASAPEAAGRPLAGPCPRDRAWRLPLAPSKEPGARPD